MYYLLHLLYHNFVIYFPFATVSFKDKAVTSSSEKAIIKFFEPTMNLDSVKKIIKLENKIIKIFI